ncbi:ammonium transporter [Mucilaginibacter straminoryzae]|nr:ammonium transporter [Mucilaginibacter straminoryzae]
MLQRAKSNWRIGAAVFAGKILGTFIVIAAMVTITGLIATKANAAETYTAHETTLINTANTIWTLVAAFLVFGMQAGFVMLEAGFARKKETVNVLMECLFDTCLCGILFWAVGYAFMFSEGNGFIGYHWFFLAGAPATYLTTGIPVVAHWLFQYAFADTCSTIVSGAMIGRTSFRGDILYSIGITGFIYPIIGHWAWGPGGFLANLGFWDFAGSTVVHTIGGVASLAGAIVLGPRLGRVFRRDDKEKGGLPPAHNLTIAAVGAFILWFGWYGFNPGSTLSAIDMQGIGRVATNTTLAACAGGFAAMYLALWFGPTKKKFDVGFTVNGVLGGLVAITCPCYWVDPIGAIALGAIAGLVVFAGTYLLEYLRIDDPVGAVPVHGLCGIWGTWSLGLFAAGKYGVTGPTGPDDSKPLTGLFYGGGFDLLKTQLIGNLTIVAATFAVSFVMMWAIRKLPHPWNLRVEEHGELGKGGLDVFEHGAPAYSEDEDEINLDSLLEGGAVKSSLTA